MRKALTTLLLGWFARLRFPTLLMITLALFVVSLIVPDFVPFVDEILLGLVTLILANWKKRAPDGAGPLDERDGRPPIDDKPSRGSSQSSGKDERR